MTDQPQHPGQDAGDSTVPDDEEALDGPGSGDLGSDTIEPPAATGASTGKALAQKGAELGIKKATGSDVAVSTLRGAQKARKGDIAGGAQDVAASGIGAATALAVGSTGVGTPVAGLAGSAATSLAQTKAFRIAVVSLVAITVIALVIQAAVITAAFAAVVGAIVPSAGQATSLLSSSSGICSDTSQTPGGPDEVVGTNIEEKVWNYLRGAGYSEEQTAGVMGNIQRESGFNPFIAEGANSTPNLSAGWGLVQWTADRHAAVRDAVIDELGDRFYIAAPAMGQLPAEISDDDVDEMVLFQMRYIISELEGDEKAAGDHLAGTTTVAQATESFESKYERAGVVALDERIAHAEDLYEQFSGSSAPDSGGTEPSPDPDPVSGTESCAGSSINPGSEVGAVAECPSEEEGCVNIEALTQPSASLSCPDGTSDHGTTTAYYQGDGIDVRLCKLDGATDVGGRPIIMNATIAAEFVAFWDEVQEEGIDLSLTSTYRSHTKQKQLYASSPGGAARPGWSNHEFGMAFDIADFPAPYTRHNCGDTSTEEGACAYPGSGQELQRWQTIREIGLKHGMYIHDQEFWHIEFIPSGTHRGQNIPVHEG